MYGLGLMHHILKGSTVILMDDSNMWLVRWNHEHIIDYYNFMVNME